MIYLDNSATTKPDDTVIESFKKVSQQYFANPSSIHKAGADVEKLQTAARNQAAQLLDVKPKEIIFTSGGTEGNNLAIKGTALQYQQRGKHIITTEIEHASVYETVKSLEQFGFEVTLLPVDQDGHVKLEDLKKSIRDDTILVSVMCVNNEIGTVQPIKEIGKLLRNYPKIAFHVDAVQAIGKVAIDIQNSFIDLCTLSGHKINGLKGTGILYKNENKQLFPLLHGGNQEFGIRSGTENVAGNVSLVRALRLTKSKEKENQVIFNELNKQLREGLKEIPGININSPLNAAKHIMHISANGLKPETVIHDLFEKGFVISTQSACSSKASDKSRVLIACGKSDEIATSGLRISLSHTTTTEEINNFIDALSDTINTLRQLLEVDKHGI